MKPYKTLIILLVFLVFFFGPAWIVNGPVRILPGISLQLPDIEGLRLFYRSNFSHEESEGIPYSDEPIVKVDSNAIGPVSLDQSTIDRSIIFGVTQTAVTSFIDSVIDRGGQTRILYYGDSQLEGDRITDKLREDLQKSIGGSGPGLLSPTQLVKYTRTVYVRSSPNWIRYNWLSYKNGDLPDRNLGPMMHVSRFLPPGIRSDEETEAWIRITPSSFADSAASTYENLRLFYGNLEDTLRILISADGRELGEQLLFPVEGVSEYSTELSDASSVVIRFNGYSSPDIWGFSLESSDGIIVDNISSRGSAGLEFSLIGSENLEVLYSMIDPDLIIFHFGINVVPNIRDDYTYYENGIIRQLEALSRLAPAAKVLVISLTDMAHIENGKLSSYQNIPLIRDAQKSAAAKTGLYFWDSWEAMGGEDGIIAWRDSIPSLAASDYVHLSYEGGRELASLLIEAMLNNNPSIDNQDPPAPVISDTIQYSYSSLPPIIKIKDWLVSIISYSPNKEMIFTSVGFWLFMFILLFGYSVLFGKPLLRNSWLFLFSLFFYYKAGGLFFFLLIISTLTDWLVGLLIYRSGRIFTRRLLVFISLLVNLGMLGYFKYTGFVTGVINSLFNTSIPVIDWLAYFSNSLFGTSFEAGMIILPIGISFFTFQTISYTIDVYRGKTKPVRNILDFGFFVSFFPQLVAGPIVRASEFIPQLYKPYSLSKREWGHALFVIINGLIKKVVVGDFIAHSLVDRVFSNPELFSGMENLLAIYGYGLQIYCDFSGYTDIAIGVALMLGFRLPVNFNSPYKAINITDFWHRWHISLSRWLKDYLYIPLGGNRKGRFRTNINLLLTMLLGGLWHGAAWRFVIWGGLHGAGLVLHKFWVKLFPRIGTRGLIWRFISIFITFNFVSFGWIFFRAQDTSTVKIMFSQMLHNFNPGSISDMLYSYSAVIVTMITGYILHWLPVSIKESYRGLFIRIPLLVKLIIVYTMGIVMYNMQFTGSSPFIYFRF